MDAYSAPTDRTTGTAVDGDPALHAGALPIAEFLLESRAVMAAVESRHRRQARGGPDSR